MEHSKLKSTLSTDSMILYANCDSQICGDDLAVHLNQLDNMQQSTSFKDSPFLDSILIGDPCSKVECYVKGTINARNFLYSYPSLNFRQRDKIAQQILEAAHTHNKGAILILKSVPVYVCGEDDFIDFVGNAIVLERFYMMLKMESSMWILSTLGGGYSALADCGLRECAETALSISKKQLNLARSIGDDVLLIRCYIYIGFALAQLKRFGRAFHMLQFCRKMAKNLNNSLLNDLTASLYMKIKYLAAKTKFVQSKNFLELSKIYEPQNV
ncbi:hypothetical protein M3Y97_00846000 [Aphelenchoides bicaudatus]|nr:hypothetical protein M3Y97_00846000 [Aphelenchoides bicaudatus]